jgi:hypothetical protein
MVNALEGGPFERGIKLDLRLSHLDCGLGKVTVARAGVAVPEDSHDEETEA